MNDFIGITLLSLCTAGLALSLAFIIMGLLLMVLPQPHRDGYLGVLLTIGGGLMIWLTLLTLPTIEYL